MSPLRNHLRALFGLGALLMLGTFLLRPGEALADPHAMFFTDRAQEQLFYNVLAALNQADFVEPPQHDQFGNRTALDGTPPIESVERIGDYIATGLVPPPQPSPTFTYDANRNVISRTPPLETREREPLPRIRVRQVTSDDGDVFYRESLQRRALVEAQRVEMSNLLCGFLLLYPGTDGARDCVEQSKRHGLPFQGG